MWLHYIPAAISDNYSVHLIVFPIINQRCHFTLKINIKLVNQWDIEFVKMCWKNTLLFLKLHTLKGPIFSEKILPKKCAVFWIFPPWDTAVQLKSADSKWNAISKYLFQDSFWHNFWAMRKIDRTFWKKATFSNVKTKWNIFKFLWPSQDYLNFIFRGLPYLEQIYRAHGAV